MAVIYADILIDMSFIANKRQKNVDEELMTWPAYTKQVARLPHFVWQLRAEKIKGQL